MSDDPAPRALVLGGDGLHRCAWGAGTPEYAVYHDTEWGRPVREDTALYERVVLEGFQSGLSWLTILRKREHFRAAFAGFDPEVVARFDEADVQRLLADAGIVRHRGKIEAAVANAKALLAMQQDEGEGALTRLLERRAPDDAALRSEGYRRPPRALADLPASTAATTVLARDLRRRGWRFLGPTTLYAALQATGFVDDHLVGCHRREGR